MKNQSVSGNFDIWHIFPRDVHLRNTSRIFLATPTLDLNISITNQNNQSEYRNSPRHFWVRQAIFFPMNVCWSQGNIPCPLFARVTITAVDFAPKIGWRSHENFFTTDRRWPRLCPHNHGKVVLVCVELLWVQSPHFLGSLIFCTNVWCLQNLLNFSGSEDLMFLEAWYFALLSAVCRQYSAV